MNFNQVFSEVIAAEKAMKVVDEKIGAARSKFERLKDDLTVRPSISTEDVQDLYEKDQMLVKLEEEKNRKQELISKKKSSLESFLSSTRVKITYVHRDSAPHFHSELWEMYFDDKHGVVIRPVG